jgi:predicted enzyme related to lactoylglutathione lyase
MSANRQLAHGQLCYIEIPATDKTNSADFYEKVFNWTIDRPYDSFEAPGMIGHWITDRPAAPESGPVVWISVDRIDDVLNVVRIAGGEVVQGVTADGPRWLAKIRDPGGNVIGIAQHGPR